MVRKSEVLLIAMVLAFVSSTGLSFTWNSFRNQSTAGLLDDDYDLLLDPARLPLIQGSRLYTSLANLVDKDEEVFSDTDNGYWLVGGSTKLGEKACPGFIHDRYTLKTPSDFTLFKLDGTPMGFAGEGELVDSRFTDTDGNGTYDTRETQHQTAQGWTEDNLSDYYVAIGSYLGTARVGALYLFSDESRDFIDPTDNFTLTKSDTNLISNGCTYHDVQVSTGDSLEEMATHAFGLATWIPAGDKLLVGGQFLYGKGSSDWSTAWDFTRDTDSSPDDPEVDTYARDEGSTQTVPSSVSILSGGLRGIYNWTPNVETWLYLTLGQMSGDVGDDAQGEYHLFDESRTTVGPGRIMLLSDTNRTVGDIAGDYSEKTMSLFSRTIARLSDKVTFGIGLGFGTGNVEGSTTWDQARVDEHLEDDGDTQTNDPDDYTETVVDTLDQSAKVTGATQTLAFPVGVEFEIKKPLVLRLGAAHQLSFGESTSTLTIKDSAAHHRVERGDGSWSEWVDPPVSNPTDGESETVKVNTSETHYYYGLGCRVSNNLQIDLMGFSDLTDLSRWKLSAIFMF